MEQLAEYEATTNNSAAAENQEVPRILNHVVGMRIADLGPGIDVC